MQNIKHRPHQIFVSIVRTQKNIWSIVFFTYFYDFMHESIIMELLLYMMFPKIYNTRGHKSSFALYIYSSHSSSKPQGGYGKFLLRLPAIRGAEVM